MAIDFTQIILLAGYRPAEKYLVLFPPPHDHVKSVCVTSPKAAELPCDAIVKTSSVSFEDACAPAIPLTLLE